MENSKYADYLLELGRIVKEEAREARKKSRGPQHEGFDEGYCLGYHRFISLMQLQGEFFDIPLDEMSLDDIDPYKELL